MLEDQSATSRPIHGECACTTGGCKDLFTDHQFAIYCRTRPRKQCIRALSNQRDDLGLLSFEILIEVPPKVCTGVIEAQFSVNSIHLLDVLSRQFEISFNVLLDPRRSLALGDDTSAMSNSPSQRYLRPRLAILLTNFDQSWVFNQLAQILALGVLITKLVSSNPSQQIPHGRFDNSLKLSDHGARAVKILTTSLLLPKGEY